MPLDKIPKLGSYNSYLLYKNIIGELRKKDCTQKKIATALNLKPSQLWNVMRVLVRYKVIKIVKYEIVVCSRRAVYRLIKDE